jgi:Zn-dependent peptidase ImmA (M78 family)
VTIREAILSGTQAAARLHREFHSEEELRNTRGPIDVFGALLRSNATVIFRPLDGLLGACLSTPAPGVMISTQRPLPVQRFTGAHELGHIIMHHNLSLDGDEILGRTASLKDSNEMQANAFAAEFLIPQWLLAVHANAQGWNRGSLKNPTVIYQLSLRVGASYEATCIALNTHKLIDGQVFAALHDVRPKAIKQDLLPGYEPEHWYRDVWVLTERDKGVVLEGQPDDLFLFRLNEKSGAGYLWDIDELKKQGFAIVRDSRDLAALGEAIGGSVQRVIAAQSAQAGVGEVLLSLRRPWQRSGVPAEELHLRYDLRGKEEGLPRALRRQLEAA